MHCLFKLVSFFVLIAKKKAPALGEHTTSYYVTILCALTCTDCCLPTADGEEAFDERVV